MRTIVVMIALSVLPAPGMRLYAAESSSSAAAVSPPSDSTESSSSDAAESSSSDTAESFSSDTAESSYSAAAPAVKLSRSGICYDRSSQYYSKLTEYQSFGSMNSCIAAG